MKKLNLLIFLITTLSSCAGYSAINYPNRKNVNKDNLELLNGEYSLELWKYLAPISGIKGLDTNIHTVKLNVINSKRLQAELKQGEVTLATRKVRGNIQNGFFSIRRKMYPIGVPALMFIYYENKARIAFTQNFDLYLEVDEYKFGWGLLLLTGGGQDGFYKIYSKK